MGMGANMRRVKKFRTLKELYEVTAQVELTKSTPVLYGSSSIRGPMDETEGSDQMNMGLSGTEGQVGRRFASGKCNETEGSGTCNMCTVLCSCCMHFRRVASPVGTKACIMDEAFAAGKDTSQCTFDDANILSHSNSGLFKDTHHTCSETSNLLSSSSSQNSVSENADSKAVPRASDMSEVIEMPLKVNSGQAVAGNHDLSESLVFQGNLVHDKQTELELRCDDISCISGADGTDVMLGDHSADANMTNLSCSSASVNSFPADLVLSVSHFLAGGRFGEVEVECCRTPTAFIEGSQPGFSGLSNKLEAPETSLKKFYPGTSSPKGELSEFSEEQVESTLTRGVAVESCGQIHDVHKGSETLEPAAKIENRESSAEAMIYPNLKVLSGNSRDMLKEPKKQESPRPSQPDINKSSSIDLEVDVKICDICGDEGQRHMLAVCSKCSDGAEHTYCMLVKLDKVPEGYWMCEVCTIKEEKENKNQLMFDTASVHPKRLSLDKMRHNYRGSSTLKVNSHLPSNAKHSAIVKGRASKTGFTSHCFAKRSGVNLEGYSVTKRRALETPIGQSSMSRSFQETVLHRDLLNKSFDNGKTKLNSAGFSLNDQSSKVSKPCRGTLLCKDSPSKNLEKRKANNSCEVLNTQSHKSSKIESKPQMRKGPLYKSQSFNIVDSKVGARLPEQGFPPKQQDAKHGAMGCSRSEGNPRMLYKSKSFNNACSDRFDVSHHTKVRMLSPNVSCSKDGKKLRSAKDWSRQSEQPSKLNEPVARLPAVGSSVSPLTYDRKLVSNAPTISLHSFGSNSHHMRSSNSPGDSKCSLDQQCRRPKYSNGDKQVADNVLQNVEHSTEAAVLASMTNKANANLPTDGSLRTELTKIAPAVVIHDNCVFPELDYIWRGGFELQRSERLACSYDGIQAHMSNCASPKVLEVVDKLPHKIVMEEVPRLSTWPTQFLETRVTENNIALYFFAKDIESYRRNYRSLLECLTKNDLALKGNVDGIELLIFSSNLLPKKSQRWNNLLFLWGVFRVRRLECMPNSQVKESIPNLEPMSNSEKKTSTPNSEHIPSSQEKISIPCKNSATLKNLITPDKEVSIRAISGQLGDSLSSSNTSYNAKQTPSFMDYLRLPPVSNESVFKICEPNVVAPEQKILGSQPNSSQQVRGDTSIQHERLPGDVLNSNISLRDCKGRLEIDLNSSCLTEEFIDSETVYEEPESMRMKSCCNGISESTRQSKFSDDGTIFGMYSAGPSFSVEDHKRFGASGINNHNHVESSKVDVMAAKGKGKMESQLPNLELSLFGENMKEFSRCVELSPGAEKLLLCETKTSAIDGVMPQFSGIVDTRNADQHSNIVSQNKYNESEECERSASTPHQLLPDQHGGISSLSLFGHRFNI